MNKINLEELIKKISILSPQRDLVEMAVDLHDICESSNNYENLFNNLIKNQQDKDTLIDNLIEIEIELDHINWHYRSLKKELKALKISTD